MQDETGCAAIALPSLHAGKNAAIQSFDSTASGPSRILRLLSSKTASDRRPPPNTSQGVQWPKEARSIAQWLQLQDRSKPLQLLTSVPEI